MGLDASERQQSSGDVLPILRLSLAQEPMAMTHVFRSFKPADSFSAENRSILGAWLGLPKERPLPPQGGVHLPVASAAPCVPQLGIYRSQPRGTRSCKANMCHSCAVCLPVFSQPPGPPPGSPAAWTLHKHSISYRTCAHTPRKRERETRAKLAR